MPFSQTEDVRPLIQWDGQGKVIVAPSPREHFAIHTQLAFENVWRLIYLHLLLQRAASSAANENDLLISVRPLHSANKSARDSSIVIHLLYHFASETFQQLIHYKGMKGQSQEAKLLQSKLESHAIDSKMKCFLLIFVNCTRRKCKKITWNVKLEFTVSHISKVKMSLLS